MNILVTGGAAFIGRWVVKQLLKDGHNVWVLDDLSNGSRKNIEEISYHQHFIELIEGDIKDQELVEKLFLKKFDICYHLGASINVQKSIDEPRTTFENDTVGTFNLLDQCKNHYVKMVFMSTCMVYDCAASAEGIRETDPIKPDSPYAGSKIAAENMVLSYYYAYGLPVVILRPFNTFAPYQKSSGEGGAVAIFIKNKLEGKELNIYCDGTQTRDLLYVEDCAGFVVQEGYSDAVNGEIIKAGLGKDISINDLAKLVIKNESKIKRVTHIHPQSEIPKLLGNYEKAKRILGWEPITDLANGIRKTEEWIKVTTSKEGVYK